MLRRRGIDDARLFTGVEFALSCKPGRVLGIDGSPAALLPCLQLALQELFWATDHAAVQLSCSLVFLSISCCRTASQRSLLRLYTDVGKACSSAASVLHDVSCSPRGPSTGTYKAREGSLRCCSASLDSPLSGTGRGGTPGGVQTLLLDPNRRAAYNGG